MRGRTSLALLSVAALWGALWTSGLAGRANAQAPTPPPPTAAPKVPLAVIPFTGP
ncbi:MAG: hypothetical protein HYZ03_04770, partial [candidate division NC10 bacterium]|nr:hypothetical protein [candidate division NC10 bacterium]